MSPIPMAAEVVERLKQLDLPLDHTNLMLTYMQGAGMKALRARLMDDEKVIGVTLLTGGTFWDITSKYRHDALIWDIGGIADGLALSAALSHIYVFGTVKPFAHVYEPTWADRLFWSYIDTGIRLASSGWDRLALLLDLAFELGLNEYCNFRKVLDRLSKPVRGLGAEPHLAELLRFRDQEFAELEGRQRGHGLRDEATHLLHVWTRFKLEYLEQHTHGKLGTIRGPHEWHEIVLRHYHHYMWGLEQTVALVEHALG